MRGLGNNGLMNMRRLGTKVLTNMRGVGNMGLMNLRVWEIRI